MVAKWKLVILTTGKLYQCVKLNLQTFDMERWQSTWENKVEYNLSESGVHALQVTDLLEGQQADLLNRSLGYVQTNGSVELRETIAALYSNAGPDNILVTNGSAEAIFVTMWSFLERDAEIVVMLPNYMQIWGLAKTFGARTKPFRLCAQKEEWVPDLRALKNAVSRRTRLIAVCNPNNPTGAILRKDSMNKICDIARKTNAWILSDEVYQGAELNGKTTPSFWERYEKVIVTNGLSKAYGLPGLRIGWILTASDLTSKLWSYHDYTTIAPTALSDYLARKALEPKMRARILARTRDILRSNLPVVREWVSRHEENFSFVPTKAGAIAYVKYNLKINSKEFAHRLLEEKRTLVVPGDHFGMDGYLRLGYGLPMNYLISGLERVDELVSQIKRS
jgi:aspartate/methionine/tyrosine aminotransferase